MNKIHLKNAEVNSENTQKRVSNGENKLQEKLGEQKAKDKGTKLDRREGSQANVLYI